MQTNNLDLIRQKCIEANPEIAETFPVGMFNCPYCGVDTPHWHRTKKEERGESDCHICVAGGEAVGSRDIYFLCPFHNEQLHSYRPWIDREGSFYIAWERSKDIPNRPIRLADVVFTYCSLAERYLNVGYISGDRLNDFEAQILNIIARWNKKDDDLTKQSPETLEFLASLLK